MSDLKQATIVTAHHADVDRLCEIFGLPHGTVCSLKLVAQDTTTEVVLTVERYVTEDEFKALLAELEANPPTKKQLTALRHTL